MLVTRLIPKLIQVALVFGLGFPQSNVSRKYQNH